METLTITVDRAMHYAARAAQVIRDAMRRELEAEMRRLLMAARMQGF